MVMPFRCHWSCGNTELTSQFVNVAGPAPPFTRRRTRGYHESVAYTLPFGPIVMSLQNPFTVAPEIGVSDDGGAGQAQLSTNAPVLRLNTLSATTADPLRCAFPASDEQAQSRLFALSA